jgi:hypothetical protein
VTFSGAAGSYIGLAVAEFSGVALTSALDGPIHGTTSGSSSTPTGPAFTPTGPTFTPRPATWWWR